MDKETAAAAIGHLERLFSAFPTAARADELLAAKTYLTALDGYSLEAIERSVNQFIRGDVPTHDGRFAPSTAELARNVRQWDEAIKLRDTPPPQLASGILSVDFGRGRIDMTKLTAAEQDEVLRTGKAPDVALGPVAARLQRMAEQKRGFIPGSPESEENAA
jgi:hypothetical protein